MTDNVIAGLFTKLPGAEITEDEMNLKAKNALPGFNLDGGIHLVNEIPRALTDAAKVFRADARVLAIQLMNEKKLAKICVNQNKLT